MRRMTIVPGLFAAGETAGAINKFVGAAAPRQARRACGAVAYMEVWIYRPLMRGRRLRGKWNGYTPRFFP